MPLWECPVCHGTYRDPEPSGGLYYHACPPLSVAELLGMDRGQVLGLLPELPANYTRADLDAALLRRDVPRPGARDENIAPGQVVLIDHRAPGGDLPRPRVKQDQPPRIFREA